MRRSRGVNVLFALPKASLTSQEASLALQEAFLHFLKAYYSVSKACIST